MDDDIASRWSPRIVDYIQAVSDTLAKQPGPHRLSVLAVSRGAGDHCRSRGATHRVDDRPVGRARRGGARRRARARGDDRPGRADLVGQLGHRLEHPPAARRARRAGRGDAGHRRRQLPGRVPQPAGRPVPARCGRRRRPRGDDRLRLGSGGEHRLAGRPAAARRVRRWPSWQWPSPTSPARRSVRCAAASRWCSPASPSPSLATAVQAFVLQRHNDVIKVVYSWILGRFTGSTWADVRLVLPYIAITIAVLLAAPPAPRRAARRRRRGRVAGHRRAPGAARGGDRGDARHRGGGERQRADRLRRHRRAARHPPGGRRRRTAG